MTVTPADLDRMANFLNELETLQRQVTLLLRNAPTGLFDVNGIMKPPSGILASGADSIFENARLRCRSILNLGYPPTVQIVSAEITVVASYMWLKAETGTSDTVHTISGGQIGDLIFCQALSGHAISFGTSDNIVTYSGGTIVTNIDQVVPLLFNGTDWIGNWRVS